MLEPSKAIPSGLAPTATVAVTELVAGLIRATAPLAFSVTQILEPSNAKRKGSPATAIDAETGMSYKLNSQEKVTMSLFFRFIRGNENLVGGQF